MGSAQATRVVLVRHGQTDWNVAKRLQGASDVPLNDTGRAQAVAAREGLWSQLRGEPVFVSSHLSRAVETASLLAAGRGPGGTDLPVVTDARLAERAYGEWEGIGADERAVAFPEEHARWASGHEPRIAGYETHAVLAARVREAAEQWAGRVPAGSDVVLVSHGSAGRVLLLALLGLPLGGRTLGHLENCAWSRVARVGAGVWTLERHNVGAGPVRVGPAGALL